MPALAEQAGMSERSFLRHYRQVIGVTPAVERARVEVTRQALGETSLPVKRIARDCGFGSEETMRRSFMRVLAALPQAYRVRFRSELNCHWICGLYRQMIPALPGRSPVRKLRATTSGDNRRPQLEV